MKETMDGAAKRANKVAQNILPSSPHHLSLSLDKKYPKSADDFWFTGASGPLQYMTYVSDAHRGVLMTRPSYDIYEDNDPPPLQMSAKVLAKGEAKKKLSIKDYQNRRKSPSPKDAELPAKGDTRINGAVHPNPPNEISATKTEDAKPREKLDMRHEPFRPDRIRSEQNGSRDRDRERERERGSQPKAQPEAGTRKRIADTEGNAPPHKRSKSDSNASKYEQPRSSRAETPRSRDRVNEKPQKDASNESLHPTANGLAPSTDRDRGDSASPMSTIQVNGTALYSTSGTSTPRKPEAPGKSNLPKLLSPLHPSIFGAKHDERERLKKPAQKGPAKTLKQDRPPPLKKPKKLSDLPDIPDLLSPTLPPLVEEELARQGTPSTIALEPTSNARKTKPAPEPLEDAEPSRPSRIVTLKFKRAIARRVKDLLSLPSKSVKDALRRERSMSVEGTPPPAKKRPRQADEAPPEPVPSKRSKLLADALSVKPAAPSTPLKQSATSMSRVASSQSQINTPGNWTGLTPAGSERPPTSSDNPDSVKGRANIESLKERFESYRGFGSKLKHTRDDLQKLPKLTAADEKRITVLHFEMVLAYMVAFYSLAQARVRDRKPPDLVYWEQLLPHLIFLHKRVQSIQALKALALQMHAVCLEQFTLAFGMLEGAQAAGHFARWAKIERSRLPVWGDAAKESGAVEDRRSRTVIGPWTQVEDAVASAFDVLWRWCDQERVDWKPLILQRERGRAPPNGTKG